MSVSRRELPQPARADYEMQFDPGTVKHLGLQMYSTLPPVIGELVANAWDANAQRVDVTLPIGVVNDDSEIVIEDDGAGMSDAVIRDAYMVVGRDRRAENKTDRTGGQLDRRVMGRKGIGKFAGFGIARQMEVETVHEGSASRFRMNYQDLVSPGAGPRRTTFPALPPTATFPTGTRVVLRSLTKFRKHGLDIKAVRRALARRFSVIGEAHKFIVAVNGVPISVEERDLQLLLDKDSAGAPYIWRYDGIEIEPGTGQRVSGWIGALDRTAKLEDGIQRGIAIMARGKLVQEPFVFEATVGQQYALSYVVGELDAEFVDEAEDTVGTSRNTLVWDTEANASFLRWGQAEVNRVAREWAERRGKDNQALLETNALYQKFLAEADGAGNSRARRIADRFVKSIAARNPLATTADLEQAVQLCIDYLEFDEFWELAEEISHADIGDSGKVLQLFRDWEVVEAKQMAKVTGGRIETIAKLQKLIESNALEVPILHNFLKEFPWVLDPRWNLIADEARYSEMLRQKFPDADKPETDRRIDFLCVRENDQLIVVEIKRPQSRASSKELQQIEEYVYFMRDHARGTTDPDLRVSRVVGYLLCGDIVNVGVVREKRAGLEKDEIFVRRYADLLEMVQRAHREFLTEYDRLRELKRRRSQG